MILIPLLFSLTSAIIFWLGIQIFTGISYETTFLVSQAALYTTIPIFPGKELGHVKFFIINSRSMRIALMVVILSVIISLINLYIYQEYILATLDGVLADRLYIMLNYTFVPIAQVGGWLYQSVLVYLLAVVFGTRIPFRSYLTFVGLAYTGFLVSTAMSLLYNICCYDLQILAMNETIQYAMGKFGEAFTLILLAFFMYYNEEKFSLSLCCLIACLPTVLIILIQIAT